MNDSHFSYKQKFLKKHTGPAWHKAPGVKDSSIKSPKTKLVI
jgi:hypothetical protein